MNAIQFRFLAALLLVVATTSAHAQGGCFDSPEAPTDVLMLVGSAGMFYGSSVLMKVVRRKRSR
jgi:XrtJ-associated TM-motif-TM protein